MIALFSIMLSLKAATMPDLPCSFNCFSDSTIRSMVTPSSPLTVKESKSKRLNWYQTKLIKVIQKRISHRVHVEEDKTPKSSKVLSIVSLVTAVLGVVTPFIGLGAYGLLFSIVGLVSGIIAFSKNKSKEHRTMAILGVVLSGVTIGFVIVSFIMIAAFFNGL